LQSGIARFRDRLRCGSGGERGLSMSAIRALALMNVMLKAGLPFHRALASSRGIAKGAHRRLIDRAFRRTLLGDCPSIEKAIERETEGLPKELVWIGRTLREYMLCSSEMERARREEMLDRAFSSALDSCRHSLRESVSGLRVPVSTIFALGIVLPIVLATMLPLWGAAYSDGLAQGLELAAGGGEEGGSGLAAPLYALAAPILLFPALCLIASTRVLFDEELAPDRGAGGNSSRILSFFALLGASSFFVLFVLELEVDPFAFLALTIPASMLAARFLEAGGHCGKEDSMYDHPSELNAISARLLSGEHFVRAVAVASEDRSEKRRMFWQAMGPAASECGEAGGFNGEMVNLISEAAKSDSGLAAQILRQVARHLNDLGTVRSEIRFELRPIAQSVMVATVFLSPFVLGIAAGFGSIGADSEGAPVEDLFIVFIVEMVIAGLWLVRRMGAGEGMLGRIAQRPYLAIGISGLAFLASWSFSRAMFA